MRKALVVIGVVMLLMVAAVGVAHAQQWEIVDTSGGAGTSWNINYASGPAWTTAQYTFYLNVVSGVPGNVSNTGNFVPPGMIGSTGSWAGGVWFSALGFAPAVVNAPYTLATYTSPGDNLSWATTHGSFLVDRNGDGDVNDPGETGADMEAAGELVPGAEAPVPPVAEIITIVLISIGLIALGGYVWYRRRNQQNALLAA